MNRPYGCGIVFSVVKETMSLPCKSDSEILAIANPIMDHLMEASTRIDYENHVRDFTDRAKSVLSKEWFDIVCKEYQGTKVFLASANLLRFSGVLIRSR